MRAGAVARLTAMSPGLAVNAGLVWVSGSNPFGSRRYTLFDDAMISMTYGRTLARTGELVWFPGAARVQGFTNPLWTLFMAGVHAAGFDDSAASFVVMVAGALLIAGASWASMSLVATVTRPGGSAPVLWVGALVPFIFPFVFWTLRGMEVGLLGLCALLTVGAARSLPDRAVISVAAAATAVGVATRLDFVLVPLAVAGWLMWLDRHEGSTRRHLIVPAVGIVSAVVVVVAQRAYWGSWLPNTYLLKVGGVGPAERISRGLAAGTKSAPTLAVSLGLIVWALRSGADRGTRALVGSCATVFATILAYSIWIGGDAWEDIALNRFVAVPLPLVLVALASVVPNLHTYSTRRSILSGALLSSATVGAAVTVNPFGANPGLVLLPWVSVIVAVMVLAWPAAGAPHKRPAVRVAVPLVAAVLVWSSNSVVRQVRAEDLLRTRTNHWVTESAVVLDSLVEDHATIATVWAGIPAYYADQPMIDLLGKSDEWIAGSAPRGSFWPGHNKWDYRHSIRDLAPDVVFQLWTRGLEPDLPDAMRSWGYERRCTRRGPLSSEGVWVRRESTHFRWDRTVSCPG